MTPELVVPKRPARTLTKHDRQVLHGVTRLHRGVRYSLFVVDEANGLGEEDVFELNVDHVARVVKQTVSAKAKAEQMPKQRPKQ